MEFHLHDEVPPSYRPVIQAAAAELNMRVGFRMIAIRSEIDRGDLHRRRNDSIDEFSVDVDRFGTSVVLKNHMLHEFGHAVGLRHYGDGANLMADRTYQVRVAPLVPGDLLVEL